ncbi:MAG TPA: hypothetical protein VJU82_07115 [Acidobacteriaceae bacterium]|nr:hypothetical protein [Acidobacteriaceae bacterium]
MRKTLTTTALLLALSCSAFGGEMATPGAPTPPPQPVSATQEPTADDVTLNGEMATPGLSQSLTQRALEVLALLPQLL